MDWLKKLAGYAPDIVGAIASGGATLPATALRIVSKELLGYETDNKDLVSQAVNNATPDQLLALKQCNNDFIIKKIELQNQENANQRLDNQQTREIHKHHWMPTAICLILTIGMIVFTGALFIIEIPEANQRMIDMLFGSYLTAWLSSINYWVSSTRSSAEKTRNSGTVK